MTLTHPPSPPEQCSDRKGRKPSLARVQSAIRAETAWTTNVPTVDSVLAEWELSKALSTVLSDQQLVTLVVQQSWKGLEIQTLGDKGRGETFLSLFTGTG